MKQLIPVFKAGTHIDSNGKEHSYSVKDLDTIVGKYNGQKPGDFHEAPIVIGHPKTNAPAWGWVESLVRQGEILFAKPKSVAPEFEEWVKAGRYKKRSISLYPDMTLRHVGFLGAVPPAIKGLPDVNYSENDQETLIEFDEFNPDDIVWPVNYRFGTIGRILRSIRDYFIEKDGVEKTNAIISQYDLDNIAQKIELPKPAMNPAFNESTNIDNLDPESLKNEEDKLEKEKEERLAKLEQENKEFAEANAKLAEQVKNQEAEKKRNESASYCEKLLGEGKITPAQKARVLDFMEILSDAGNRDFAEGDKKVSKSALVEFQEFLSGLPKQVEFGETATGKTASSEANKPNTSSDFGESSVDEERADLDRKVRDRMKKDSLSYAEALNCEIGGN